MSGLNWRDHLSTTTTKSFHATWNGRGEFYTGIKTGDRVLVKARFYQWSDHRSTDGTISVLDSGNASLSISERQFDLLSDWELAPEVSLIGN